MNKKVSIIIPVYNAEKFLDKCIESLQNQTYKNLEFVFVDDGSKDNSVNILKKYAKKDKRIKIIKQKNAGPGPARNNGMKQSTGDYLTFVDSDDTIDSDYIEQLMTHIKDNDMILCGFQRVDSNGKVVGKKVPSEKLIDCFRLPATLCKLYRSSIIKENNIEFPPGKVGEDLIFASKFYSKANKMTSINYIGYNYLVNTSSITQNIDDSLTNKLVRVVKEIDECYNLDKYGDLSLYFYLKTLIINLLIYPKKRSFDDYYQTYQESFKWLENKYKELNRKIKLKWYHGEEFKINIFINIFILCRKLHIIKPFLKLIRKLNYSL